MTRQRRLLTLGAAGAWIVTIVFALVGDGVEPSGTGLTRAVTAYGHQVVWLLLALSLTWAAVRGRWQRLSGALALGGLAVYAMFVLAVLSGS